MSKPKSNSDPELKLFMLDNFDFDGLKAAGFWPKELRKNDYEAQAARVCQFFGYQNVYEYKSIQAVITQQTDNVTTGRIRDRVDREGYKPGGGFHISTSCPTDFECPYCTKLQNASDYKAFQTNGRATVKCSGCKRKLELLSDITGKKFTVTGKHKEP